MVVGAAVAACDCRRFGGLWPDGSAVARGGIFLQERLLFAFAPIVV